MKKILFLLLILVHSYAYSQVGLGAFAIGVNSLFDKVTQAIQQAEQTGLVLEVNAGAQILNLLTQAQSIYEKELKSTSQQLTSQQQQFISSVEGMITNLQNNIINGLEKSIQQTANTIPFSKTFPQVHTYTGYLVAPGNGNVFITMKGNFFDIGTRNYDSYIWVGNKAFKNTIKTTQSIVFAVPKTEFTATKFINYIPAKVEIPYKKSFLLFFKKRKQADFLVNCIILPPTPGSYEMIYTTMENKREVVQDFCQGLIWDSSQDDYEAIHGCHMQDGWICDINSVEYDLMRTEGRKGKDWYDKGNASTPTYVGWKFKTLHKGLGTSGKLTVTLKYQKYRYIKTPVERIVSRNINWGEQKVETVPNGATWKLIYHRFDGKDFEIASTDETNAYFKVKATANQVTITTAN